MPGRDGSRSICRPFGGRFANAFSGGNHTPCVPAPCAAQPYGNLTTSVTTYCPPISYSAALPAIEIQPSAAESIDSLNNEAAEVLAATPRENRLPNGVATHYFIDGKIYNREGTLIGSANLIVSSLDPQARANSLARLKDASEVNDFMKITTPNGRSTIIDPRNTVEDGKPVRIAFGPPPGTVATFNAETRLVTNFERRTVTEVIYKPASSASNFKLEDKFNVISTADGVTMLADKADGRIARLKNGELEWKVAVSTGSHMHTPDGEIIYGEAGWVKDKSYQPSAALNPTGAAPTTGTRPADEPKGILPPYPPPVIIQPDTKTRDAQPVLPKLVEAPPVSKAPTTAAEIAKVRANNGWLLFELAKFTGIDGGIVKLGDEQVYLGNGNHVKTSFTPSGASVTLRINSVAVNFDTDSTGALKWKLTDEFGKEKGNNPAAFELGDGEPRATRHAKLIINDLISKWTALSKDAAPTPLTLPERKLPKDFSRPETFEEGVDLLKAYAKHISSMSDLGVHAFFSDERTKENPNGNRWLTFRIDDEVVTYHLKYQRPHKILPNGVKMELIGGTPILVWERGGSDLSKASNEVKMWFSEFEEKLGVRKP